MSIVLKEVVSKKDLKAFVKFPFKLYKNNKYWAPPFIRDELKTLDPKINPAFEHSRAKYWLAYKDGKIAGRIACIINNKVIEKWNVKKHGFHGWILLMTLRYRTVFFRLLRNGQKSRVWIP